jgi:site-specific recombinase XerD
MSGRSVSVWWNKQTKAWVTEIDRKRFTLAKGRGNRRQALDALAELLRERELLAKVNGAISVAGLCERFLADAKEHLSPATYESYQYACQKLVDALGATDAHTLRPADIAAFSQSLAKTLGDTSRAIVLRSVQRCFNWGAEERLIPPHELGRIRKPRPKLRDRYVTDEEFQTLLRSTNATRNNRRGASFRRFLLAMEWTGCRPGEIAKLTWENVHLERNLALLWTHKTDRTGKPKVIPLIPKFKRLLLWLKQKSETGHVFLNSRGCPWNRHSIAKRMADARLKAGLTSDVVPYTLRHRAATNAILRTGDLKMTSALLNHTSVTTTERYVHLANEALVDFSTRALG